MTRRPDMVEQSEIQERQERVWHLVVVRRVSEREAAQILNVNERTVRRDLAAMRARGIRALQELSTQRNVLSVATEMYSQLSAVLREAWATVQAADLAAPVRVRALNTVRATIRDMADILQSLGLLPKAPEEVIVSAQDPGQLNDAQLEAAVAFFLSLSSDRRPALPGAGEPARPAGLDRAEPADPDEG
jgi:transposase